MSETRVQRASRNDRAGSNATREIRAERGSRNERAGIEGTREAHDDRSPLFLPIIFVGGLVFGVGLAVSQMARPEVVLNFLQFDDFGLLFVMGGAALVTALVFAIATNLLDTAPLTGTPYTRRLKSMDRNVLLGGAIFGVGWGLSGICPGAAYASLGIGNFPILWGIAGMFLGAYLQGYWRSRRSHGDAATVSPRASE